MTLESAAGGCFAGHSSALKTCGRSVPDFKRRETHIEDSRVTLCQYRLSVIYIHLTLREAALEALLINYRKIQAAWSKHKEERGDDKRRLKRHKSRDQPAGDDARLQIIIICQSD